MRELEYCGYTASLIEELQGKACSLQDRVEVSSNGKYRLLDERTPRQKKRKAHPNDAKSSQEVRRFKKSKLSDVVDLI